MIQSEIASLMHQYGSNKRGVCAVIAVDKKSVLSMPSYLDLLGKAFSPIEGDFYVEDIVLKEGASWKDVSKDVNIQVDLKEEEKLTGQNKDFTYTVSLILPNDNFEARGKIIREYDNREWILIVKERTGAWRVLGGLERACRFSAELSTGQVNKDANQYECGFTWQIGGRRAFYTMATPNYDSFTIVWFNKINTYMRLVIDESVIIDYGVAGQALYATPTGTDRTITMKYPSTSGSFTIYHRNKAKKIEMVNFSVYNKAEQLNGNLPSSLQTLKANGNELFTAASNSWTNKLKLIELQNNCFDDATLEAFLEILDTLGGTNGTLRIQNQVPYQPLTAAANTHRLNLVAKGWTITYTP